MMDLADNNMRVIRLRVRQPLERTDFCICRGCPFCVQENKGDYKDKA